MRQWHLPVKPIECFACYDLGIVIDPFKQNERIRCECQGRVSRGNAIKAIMAIPLTALEWEQLDSGIRAFGWVELAERYGL